MKAMRFDVPLAALVALAGCSSSDVDTGSDPEETTNEEPEEVLGPSEAYDKKYAHCDLDTGYANDDLCLVPPAREEGFQLHYGPSDYDDPEDIYLIPGGGETNEYVEMETPNDTEVYFKEYHGRIRSGTHHMILYANDDQALQAFGGRFLIGGQAALGEEGGRVDIPRPSDKMIEENQGLAFRLDPHTGIRFNMHYVNLTTEPILAEAWVNFHYIDDDDVKETMEAVTFYGGLDMSIAPGTEEVVKGSCRIPESGPDELRIVGLSGHMHAHGRRFSAYKVSADEEGNENSELIYETFEWAEPDQIQYNSVDKFEMPNREAQIGGGASGILTLKKGERIDYECDFANHDLDKPLVFANEAYTAEMCNLFGYYTPGMGGPWVCASTSAGTFDMDQLGMGR